MYNLVFNIKLLHAFVVVMIGLLGNSNAAQAFSGSDQATIANSVRNCVKFGKHIGMKGCLLILAARIASKAGREVTFEVIKHSLIAAGLEGLAHKWIAWASTETDIAIPVNRDFEKPPPGFSIQ